MKIRTRGEAAKELGVNRETIRDLCRLHNLTPKTMPYNGMVKGLDDADMKVLRRSLGLTQRAASA